MIAVDIIEQGGRGGVFQHAAEVALLAANHGHPVVLHTATDHEHVDLPGVSICRCSHWYRSVRPKPLRLALIVATYIFSTIPHLRWRSRRALMHLQGQWGGGMYAAIILMIPRRRLIWSPHNTFVRSGTGLQQTIFRICVGRPEVVVCFSPTDVARLHELGAQCVIQMPLVQYTERPSPERVDAWRLRLARDSSAPIVVLAGQIRPDKGVADFLAAADALRGQANFAVVGEDSGFAKDASDINAQLGYPATIDCGYLPLNEFLAMIAASDLVAAPYPQASSSGVVAVAHRLGTRAVAYPVGGLVDSGATLTAAPTPAALTDGILTALEAQLPSEIPDDSWLKLYALAAGAHS